MDIENKYPGIDAYLDNTDDYVNSASELIFNGERFLVVTQEGEFDGGQILLRESQDGWIPVDSDTNIDVARNSLDLPAGLGASPISRTCSPSSAEDHELVHEVIKGAVNEFSSASGPDGGNLACVWAVRHLVRQALDRWITRTDGTAVFDAELRVCYGSTLQEEEVSAGGIIISPTVTRSDGRRNIGHVGLLGPGGMGEDRLIYSNSSRDKMWKQNFTLGSWIKRYRTMKGLKVRFYPLPQNLAVS